MHAYPRVSLSSLVLCRRSSIDDAVANGAVGPLSVDIVVQVVMKCDGTLAA